MRIKRISSAIAATYRGSRWRSLKQGRKERQYARVSGNHPGWTGEDGRAYRQLRGGKCPIYSGTTRLQPWALVREPYE